MNITIFPKIDSPLLREKVEAIYKQVELIPYSKIYVELNLDPTIYFAIQIGEKQLIQLTISLEDNPDNEVVFSYYEDHKYIYGGLLSFDKFIQGALAIKVI